MTPARSLARSLGAATVTAALLLGALPALAEETEDSPAVTEERTDETAEAGTDEGVEYAGDPASESAEARTEERRLTDVASMVDSTRWAFATGAAPLALPTGETSTIVLLAREEPYTLQELADLVPDAVQQESEGSYLISSHLVIDRGATLRIHDDSGLSVHLDSTAESFASIVSIGGALDVAGGEDEPVQITGWDSSRQTADHETSDGRAYIRALAGSVEARDVELRNLGFWSGPTGGLALTGSDAPKIETASGEVVSDPGEETLVEPDPNSLVLLPDPDEKKHDRSVTASLERVSAHDSALGLFAANTAQLDISDADFSGNLLDGVVLHRFVTQAHLKEVTAHRNGGDGIRAGRGTTDVSIEGARASGNRGNGITVNGSALADGPSATGVATGAFGGHAVTNSSLTGNGHYGIQVTGGSGIAVRDNHVSRHTSGIVVSGAASEMEVSGNRVRSSTEHGISLRDDITGAQIHGNTIGGADTAIYARGSAGEITGNTISRATNHGITVIDQPETTTVSRNSIAGIGPAAIDTSRSGTSVVLVANSAGQWEVTKPLPVILQRIFQPLTVLWLVIVVLLVATAGTTARWRPGRRPRSHPYADHTPLTELSAGVVLPRDLGTPASGGSRAGHGRRRLPHPRSPVGPDRATGPDPRGGLHA